MSMCELPGDIDDSQTLLWSDPTLEEYALALLDALELAARSGGRPAFDSLFDRGFDRVYAWSYLRVGRNAKRAQALTLEILLGAARVLAQREAEARDSSAREPER
jgi:hypothetical protein